jgi:hypothetical protein
MTRMAKAAAVGLSIGLVRNLGRSYVAASGGAQTAAAGSIAGRTATANLAGFLSNGVRDGFTPTAQRMELGAFVGLDAETLLAAFIDVLAPPGGMREEAVARIAMIDTLQYLFETYNVGEDGLASLDSIDNAAIGVIVEHSVVTYVNGRIQQELANRIEQGTLTDGDANRMMDDIAGFVAEIVRLDFAELDLVSLDWHGSEGQGLVTRFYEDAYALIGDET